MSRGSMMQNASLTGARLRTPRAAAIAGIVFAALLMTSLTLLRLSVPIDPLERGTWLGSGSNRVMLALNLVPFAGIAFLWFIGVLRARLGELEDRFFATVFLGSGILFLALLFVAAAAAGALIMVHADQDQTLAPSATFTLARALSYSIMNIYAVKVAGVFMITTSTIALYTAIAARWIAYLGYALAAFLLLGGGFTDWTFLVFPLWVLLMSGDVLVDNLRRPQRRQAGIDDAATPPHGER
jgi:MFS family permease